MFGILETGDAIRFGIGVFSKERESIFAGELSLVAKRVGRGECDMSLQRYSRQTVFDGIGVVGQERLLHSRVAVIGMGATGSVIANSLCRAGVGFLRLIDRDYVELSNLQRQVLYTEEDARQQTPKAAAACEHLKEVNSEIELEPVIVDVNSSNIEMLVSDIDLVLDGSDNLEIRYLINEACFKASKPWVYSGAIVGSGMTMNIIPGKTSCLRCLFPHSLPSGAGPTCSTAGVLNGVTGVIASIAATEALKILIGSSNVRKTLLTIDIWSNQFDEITVEQNEDCPVCGHHEYNLLGRISGSYMTSLCGRDSIQVVPGVKRTVDMEQFAKRLEGIGTVRYNKFMLQFSSGEIEFSLFPDGRAIVSKVKNESAAKSIYSEYIGL
jgi:molybdopterin/thiamine biosynthesis adenylyltransferase